MGGSQPELVPQLRDPRPTLKNIVRIINSHNSGKNFHEPEDMNGLSVAAASKESATGWEGEGEDGGGSLQAAAQLVQLRTVVAGKHSEHSLNIVFTTTMGSDMINTI